MNGYLYRGKGVVTMLGVDHGGAGKVVAENDRFIVIKWPAHKYWSGIGETSYASPETVVYKKHHHDGEQKIYAEAIIEWSHKRAKDA